jgi:hypothetical protein
VARWITARLHLVEQDADAQLRAGQRQVGVDLALEHVGAVDGVGRQGLVARGRCGHVESFLLRQVEHGLDHPRPAVQAHVRRLPAGEQDDDGVVEHLAPVGKVAVHAAGFHRRAGKVRSQEPGDGRPDQAHHGDRPDAGGGEQVRAVGRGLGRGHVPCLM